MNLQNLKLKKSITILLTSAGGLTGVFLSKHFKKSGNYRIVAVDVENNNPLKKWVDAFYKVSSIREEAFLSEIKEIIEKESVDIIIPVSSHDIDFFSRLNVKNELEKVRMLTMDYDNHMMLHDKERCYRYLSQIGISTPKVFLSDDEIEYPCVIKSKISTGSKDTIIIYDEKDYNYWMSKIENSIVVQYLKGSEYTVDCLFDLKGACIGANIRERIKTIGGGATVTANRNSLDISSTITKLETSGIIRGPVNFQFKILPNDKICVFDFNTRLASGGLPLTVESGFDIPNRLIKLISEGTVDKWKAEIKNEGKTMIRYYEEYFVNGHE